MVKIMNDNEILNEGITLLIEEMGVVKAQKFISLINQEKFDYTKWRKDLFKNKTVKEISQEAMDYLKDIEETKK